MGKRKLKVAWWYHDIGELKSFLIEVTKIPWIYLSGFEHVILTITDEKNVSQNFVIKSNHSLFFFFFFFFRIWQDHYTIIKLVKANIGLRRDQNLLKLVYQQALSLLHAFLQVSSHALAVLSGELPNPSVISSLKTTLCVLTDAMRCCFSFV